MLTSVSWNCLKRCLQEVLMQRTKSCQSDYGIKLLCWINLGQVAIPIGCGCMQPSSRHKKSAHRTYWSNLNRVKAITFVLTTAISGNKSECKAITVRTMCNYFSDLKACSCGNGPDGVWIGHSCKQGGGKLNNVHSKQPPQDQNSDDTTQSPKFHRCPTPGCGNNVPGPAHPHPFAVFSMLIFTTWHEYLWSFFDFWPYCLTMLWN